MQSKHDNVTYSLLQVANQTQASITIKSSFPLHYLHLIFDLTFHYTLFYQSIKQTDPKEDSYVFSNFLFNITSEI